MMGILQNAETRRNRRYPRKAISHWPPYGRARVGRRHTGQRRRLHPNYPRAPYNRRRASETKMWNLKLMLRRLELEERNEQRAENFMKRLRSMIKKNTEKKKKRGLFRRKKQEEESFSGCAQLDVFEESESEFSWTKR